MADTTTNDVRRVVPNEEHCINKMAHPFTADMLLHVKILRSRRENAYRFISETYKLFCILEIKRDRN